MDKLKFQKAIAQLYIDVDTVKKELQEQKNIRQFEEDFLSNLNNYNEIQNNFFNQEIESFKEIIKHKKESLLKNYTIKDIEKTLEENAKKYFDLTTSFIKVNPKFYDALVSITPVWENDFNKMEEYIDNLKDAHPHVKIIKKEVYANKGTSASYGKFDIATDMNTAFEISVEVQGNYAAQLQINFLGINPAFIPTFDEKELSNADSIGNKKVNNYLDLNVIASLNKGFISPYDTPINIMKIFLNDVFANKINYHYIDSQLGHKVTLTDAAREFLTKNP